MPAVCLANSRESQCDVVLVAAALTGLALLARSGRLERAGLYPRRDDRPPGCALQSRSLAGAVRAAARLRRKNQAPL